MFQPSVKFDKALWQRIESAARGQPYVARRVSATSWNGSWRASKAPARKRRSSEN